MKLIVAAVLIVPLLAHASTQVEAVAVCQSASDAVRAMADRRDEGMSKHDAVKQISDGTPEQQAAAFTLIDLVWDYPQYSGAKIAGDFYQTCLKQQSKYIRPH